MTASCNCFALRQATRHVTQFYDLALAPSNLRSTQYSLLRQIDTLGSSSLNPLAEIMIMDRATLGHNLRLLEERGLIHLAVGIDRRSREASVTEAGRQAIAEAEPLWQRAHAIYEKEIGTDVSVAVRALLHRIATTGLALA